jgi:hypothetical protein
VTVRSRTALAAIALLAVGVAAGGAGTSKAAVTQTPVLQSVPAPPKWYPGTDGRFHVQYELMLTNAVPLDIDVATVEIRGDGRRIDLLSGDRLAAAFAPLGSETGSTTELPPASVGVVWMDLSFPSRRDIPRRISHRLTIDIGSGQPVGPVLSYTGARTAVSPDPPTAIGPPLRGGRWVAVGGAEGPHRRAFLAVNGHLRLAQRFAVDFSALLDASGRTHSGDASENSSYFNYRQPLIAVAGGKVVEAVDGIPDQVPNENVPVPLAEADGNHVILRLARGVFAGYAHLAPSTVRVERSDHVRAGQTLGRLGNSGNSTGPHLHFQLMDRAAFTDADGLPFVLRSFRFDGFVPSLEELIDADLAGTPVPIDPAQAGNRRLRGFTFVDAVTFSGD